MVLYFQEYCEIPDKTKVLGGNKHHNSRDLVKIHMVHFTNFSVLLRDQWGRIVFSIFPSAFFHNWFLLLPVMLLWEATNHLPMTCLTWRKDRTEKVDKWSHSVFLSLTCTYMRCIYLDSPFLFPPSQEMLRARQGWRICLSNCGSTFSNCYLKISSK